MKDSFLLYQQKNNGEDKANSYILLHPHKTDWIKINETGLEIARHLINDGCTLQQSVKKLTEKYGISQETAIRDVSFVQGQLVAHKFLEITENTKNSAQRIPDSLYIHITNRCNLTCLQCYEACPEEKNRKDLSTQTLIRLLDELESIGGKSVSLSGGEPLLHPHAKQVIQHAINKNLKVQLISNGTLITQEWAEFFAAMNNIEIQISIDGATKEVHDKIRGHGAFEKMLDGFHNLTHVGLKNKVVLCTTVMQYNMNDLKNLIRLGENLGVSKMRFIPLRCDGSAMNNWDVISSEFKNKDHEAFNQYVNDLYQQKKCSLEITCGLSGLYLKTPEEDQYQGIWCPVGAKPSIEVNGDVYACTLLNNDQYKLGNIHEQSLLDLSKSINMKTVNQALHQRKTEIQKCSECTWRNLCQAGCMAVAYKEKGTFWDTDDFCDYRKSFYENAFDLL